MAKAVKIGLIGGGGGSPKDIGANEVPQYLKKIEIWSSADGSGSGGVITGIRFTYKDIHGKEHIVPSKDACWGMMTDNHNEFIVHHEDGDYVKMIEGTIGKAPDYGLVVITSLKVTTYKGKTSDTSGDPANGTPFTVPLNNAAIGAFFAKTGTYLDAVGFYACPN